MKTNTFVRMGIVLTFASISAEAAMLNIQPPSRTVPIGATFQVALTMSDLGVGAAPSVGVYDIDLTFNPTILKFQSVTFGDPGLGAQLDLSGLGTITSVDDSIAGVVNHFELSLDLPADLDALQMDAFTLSVFTFTALAPGTSALDPRINFLGDSLGDPLTASIAGGHVKVTGTAVPDSGSGFWLITLGATWIGLQRRPPSQRSPKT